MKDRKELPKRKSTRLKNYDYSSSGAYFVTVCIQDRKQILSEIINLNQPVGEGLAPPDTNNNVNPVGEGLAPPDTNRPFSMCQTRLKPCGKIAEEQLRLLETRYDNVTVKDYVIMPDHIHAIILLRGQTGGASPSPTLNNIICAFKSLTSRICKQRYGIVKMFQRSYAEHIVRDTEDYEIRRKYIYENPIRWYYNELNSNE